MNYFKKSLGQNFLIDKNIVKKIINLIDIKNKNILEVGSGRGALTDEIIKKKPKSFLIIEKDFVLFKALKSKYSKLKNIEVLNCDILKLDIEKKIKKNTIVFGNLPYNISSQILIRFIKFKNWSSFTDLIFMFQKELGEKIICEYPCSNYGRISIIRNYKLKVQEKFLISPTCFFPKPKINSMLIHFKPYKNTLFKIKNINNLEKVTNVIFSNKRKMINKSIKKILKKDQVPKCLNLNKRPAEINPEMYYAIVEIYERG